MAIFPTKNILQIKNHIAILEEFQVPSHFGSGLHLARLQGSYCLGTLVHLYELRSPCFHVHCKLITRFIGQKI